MSDCSIASSIRDAGGDGDLHQELGRVQHHFHGGPGRLVGREEFGVLFVVGGQVLPCRQMGGHGQHVLESGAGRFQDRLDALEDVVGLLANAFTDFAGDRVSAGLAGHEDQIAEPGSGRQIGIGRSEIAPGSLLSWAFPSPIGPNVPRVVEPV